MSCAKTKSQRKNTKDYEFAKTLMDAAHVLMEVEYKKPEPERVKLTHYWLAEQMNIKNHIAYKLLILMAYKRRHFCIKLPLGPIFWDNALVPCGVVMDAISNARRQARDLDQKLLMSM